jgi:predicted permease
VLDRIYILALVGWLVRKLGTLPVGGMLTFVMSVLVVLEALLPCLLLLPSSDVF